MCVGRRQRARGEDPPNQRVSSGPPTYSAHLNLSPHFLLHLRDLQVAYIIQLVTSQTLFHMIFVLEVPMYPSFNQKPHGLKAEASESCIKSHDLKAEVGKPCIMS